MACRLELAQDVGRDMAGDASVFRRVVATASVLAVTIGTGVLLGMSAKTSEERETTLGLDLPSLVAEKQDSVAEAEQTNSELQEEVQLLVGDLETLPGDMAELPFLAQSVTGPGVVVELTDAPADLAQNTDVNPNDLVVHQEDVNAVMNALWRGGAEAMSVQGLRVTPRTPIRCIGNVILVGGSVFSPPYKIEAIGDPGLLRESVETDPQIQIYMQYVRAYGIGWHLATATDITLAPLSEGLSFKYAGALGEGNA